MMFCEQCLCAVQLFPVTGSISQCHSLQVLSMVHPMQGLVIPWHFLCMNIFLCLLLPQVFSHSSSLGAIVCVCCVCVCTPTQMCRNAHTCAQMEGIDICRPTIQWPPASSTGFGTLSKIFTFLKPTLASFSSEKLEDG